MISDDSEGDFSQPDEEEIELALAEIERGEFTDARELLREIKALTRS